MHDAVTRRDHVHVVERSLGPVDEVETVRVAALFHVTVFLERVFLETRVLYRQGVIHDQLGRYHRIDFGGVTALLGDGVTQTGQVDQCGLTQDVVTHHARRVPREIHGALAFDQLLQGIGEIRRIAATHQLFGQDTRGERKFVIGPRLDGVDSRTGVEIVQLGAGKLLAIFSVHSLGLLSGISIGV